MCLNDAFLDLSNFFPFDQAISVIFDDDPHPIGYRSGLMQDDLGCSTAVNTRVVEQICHNAGESPTVTKNRDVADAIFNDDLRSWKGTRGYRLTNEFAECERFEDKSNGSGIEAGNFQQILNEPLKTGNIAR
jgi:hypothetical protein